MKTDEFELMALAFGWKKLDDFHWITPSGRIVTAALDPEQSDLQKENVDLRISSN